MSIEARDWEEDWLDVEPIPQNEGPRPAVPIAYSSEFVRVMGYFRAALEKDERSERSLSLTERTIALNSANYTAWHFRRLCLEAVGYDLSVELDYLDGMAEGNAKNYQLWHHRRWVAQTLGQGAAARELKFSEQALTRGDSKNYHIWSHRQWVLKELRGATWQEELDFCARLLEADVWNNSAWNQRMFVFRVLFPRSAQGEGEGASPGTPCPGGEGEERAAVLNVAGQLEVFNGEVEYVLFKIDETPANESAWAYLSGIFKLWGRSMQDDPAVMALCKRIILRRESEDGSLDGAPLVSDGRVHALSLLVELLSEGADPAAIAEASCVGSDRATSLDLGKHLCEKLQELDRMRASYWMMRKGLMGTSV